MAKNRMQQSPHLRCTRCDGWGWVTISSIIDPRHQAGEENCPRCGGDGNEPRRMQAVKARPLPKQKPMTMAEFEEQVLKWSADRDVSFSLDFKPEHFDDYEMSYEWISPQDREKALNGGGPWTLAVLGHDIEPGISLAASSLLTLLQMFAQYDLQPIPPKQRGR